MAFNIFISYSTKDLEIAMKLQTYLSQIQGTSVFLAETTLIVGKLSDAIISEIKKCDLFIILYSKNSHNSNYVQQEIGVAIANNKKIIPILLDAETKPDAMLKDYKYLSIYDEDKRNTQIPQLYNYIVEESQKKADIQAVLTLGIIFLLGFLILKE
ncbi:MAG: toll/interleukin-1 receptor domain-containing protein [candidate division WOR-3 bacterium]|nr:toll/interleukin-1 receptor domain-containing protein [candidate division WOR-3 bacterium]